MGPRWRMHCVQTLDLSQSCHCSRPTRVSQKRAPRQPAPSTHLCVCVRARQMIAGRAQLPPVQSQQQLWSFCVPGYIRPTIEI